jgi:hypothetical protein
VAIKNSSKSSKIPTLASEDNASSPAKVAGVEVTTPAKTSPAAPEDPTVPVRKYLMGGRVRVHRIEPMAVWAESQGWSVATVSQWKKLFENF